MFLLTSFEGVCFWSSVGVEGPETLYQSNSSFWAANGIECALEFASGWLNKPPLEPASNLSFRFFSLGIGDLALLNVNRFFAVSSCIIFAVGQRYNWVHHIRVQRLLPPQQ